MLPKIQKILYTTDLGPGASYVFRYALAQARQHQATIIAVHAMEPLSTFGQSLVEQYITHESSTEMHQKAQENVKAVLTERLRELCSKECEGATSCENAVDAIHVVKGYPHDVILKMAKDNDADLIVMGTLKHSLMGEFMIGSTTRKVMRNTTLPVLVINIPKEESGE
ncbi:MAG: universal stress protein [Desulfopila sp.]|jgi:nucleotide-binding universal stress UspA family protein|nr:universal stress protein [Desulfopila sp.]